MGNTPIRMGAIAPDFELKDQYDRGFRLSGFAGTRVLLSFHPLAWTPVCGEQMRSLEVQAGGLAAMNTVAAGISIDSIPSKRAWAAELGIKETRLLCDFWPHGAVAHAFGVFRVEEGFSERANIIVDGHGRIVFIKVYEMSRLPDIEEILDALKKTP